MAKLLHAVDYLAASEKQPPRSVCVLFGDEPFLHRQALLAIRSAVLGCDDGEFSLATFDGAAAKTAAGANAKNDKGPEPKTKLHDVLDELGTVAMFGRGGRLVVVEQADDFIAYYRKELEDYVAGPNASGVLVLDVKSFPANTRLFKAVSAEGFVVDCNAPSAGRLTRWLAAWAKQAHRVQLPSDTAEMLVELIGPELGLLDQELAKLALAAGDDKKITPELVKSVGGWRVETTWVMLDAALEGNAPEAMRQLDRLLAAGEEPIAILAQISASLRRFAAATRIVLQAEAAGRRIQPHRALEQAGVKAFVVRKAVEQLRRLGRHRGSQLYDWLLEADLDLKGGSALPKRLILERLIIRLAAPKEAIGSR